MTVPGTLEHWVWQDVVGFRDNPGQVIEQLADQLGTREDETRRLAAEISDLDRAASDLQRQRDRLLGLYRRGGISDDDLDQQLHQVSLEEDDVSSSLSILRSKEMVANRRAAKMSSAKDVLAELRRCDQESMSWEARRRLVELLVSEIKITSIEVDGKPDVQADVVYTFTPIATRTGRGSSRRSA